MSRPRVIRKVTKMGRDGRPKVVRDRRLQLTAERVVASTPKKCCQENCWAVEHLIAPGSTYIKITYPRIGFSRYPVSKVFHLGCTPAETHPMMRFLAASWPNKLPWPSRSSVTP